MCQDGTKISRLITTKSSSPAYKKGSEGLLDDHEHFLRGRGLITESDTQHNCTVCQEEIKEGDGRRQAIFEATSNDANYRLTTAGALPKC